MRSIINSFVTSSKTTITSNGRIISSSNSSLEVIEGSGKLATKPLTPQAFTELLLEGSMDIDVQCGETASIEITADDNIVDLIEVSYSGNQLTIGLKPNTSFNTNSPIIAKITNPNLQAVTCKGSGDISIENLNEPKLAVRIMGSGDVHLSGKAHSASFDIMGSGDILASALKTEHVTASVMGSGDIELIAIESLTAQVMGSGDIDVINTPNTVSTTCMGSGSIKVKK